MFLCDILQFSKVFQLIIIIVFIMVTCVSDSDVTIAERLVFIEVIDDG